MSAEFVLSDRWVSIDVETAGPDPGEFALLAVGACLVRDPDIGCSLELVPDHDTTDPSAMAVHGLTMDHLRRNGLPPEVAMSSLEAWLAEHVSSAPIMIAFNAPFDWMFINHYFWKYLGRNPFGHAAIDIKAFAMGWLGQPWSTTTFPALAEQMGLAPSLSHQALADAQQQARLLAAIVDYPRT